ncbi:hypothetical protein WOLCODRAFT_163828 [Wolfiporia cocos MD-104 SS10]|uniref:Uncharacterized protein n=1 Tax=Wolfiporia cocos (strain MD-104) TaxID=742152 RepID=A0A2H3JUC5_WOLCO|nr:hypothetical protein WOLCODRAFT_163828 [Wolfiporia cocos MD-104 SS10]
MWRWCLRTTRDVSVVASGIALNRTRLPFHHVSFLRQYVNTYATHGRRCYSRPYKNSSEGTFASTDSSNAGAIALDQTSNISSGTGGLSTAEGAATNVGGPVGHIDASAHSGVDDVLPARLSDSSHSGPQQEDAPPVLDDRPGSLQAVTGTSTPQDESLRSSPADRARVLKELLASDRPIVPSPKSNIVRYIYDLYHSASRDVEQSPLTSAELSSLISLFGSLSLSAPQQVYSSVYRHHFLPHFPETAFRPHWTLVKVIIHRKRKLHMPLSKADRYWLMRAHLAQSVDEPREALLQVARMQYECLRSHRSVEIHISYLQALLSASNPDRIAEAARRLCDLIAWYDEWTPHLLRILWQVVFDATLSLGLKADFLSALRQRLSTSSCDLHSRSGRPGGADSAETQRIDSNLRPLGPIGVRDLVNSLRNSCFPSARTHVILETQLSQWARRLASAVFGSLEEGGKLVETQWNCLVLLAVALNRQGRTSGPTALIAHDGPHSAAAAEWRAICVLASLERLVDPASEATDEIARKLNHILDKLWSSWYDAVTANHAQPTPIIFRSICTLFFRLAGQTKNRTVVERCVDLCDAQKLWSVTDTDPIETSSLQLLAQEQLISALLCGASIERALVYISKRIADPSMLSTVISRAISTLAASHTDTAVDTQAAAHRLGIVASASAITDLAVAVADGGHIAAALRHLDDSQLTHAQHLLIIHHILLAMVRTDHHSRSVYLIGEIADAILRQVSFSAPPPSFRVALQPALLYLPRANQAKTAMSIVQHIVDATPSYFTAGFYGKFIVALLRARHFNFALRVHKLARKLDMRKHLPSLHSFVIYCSRHGAGAIAANVAASIGKPPRQLASAYALTRRLGFRERVPRYVLTLKIPTFLNRDPSRRVHAARAIHALVRVGSLRMAKKLYAQMRTEQDQATRTLIGNDILHGSLFHRRRRNKQRLKKALRTLTELTRDYGFVPDRVTMNILMKSLLEWTSYVDGDKLRGLFDHMVRSGFPTGGLEFPKGVPFGTASGAGAGMINMPSVDSTMKFKRHVRPLYKMFIKAFHLRDDAYGARTVWKILKAVEAESNDLTRMIGKHMARKRIKRRQAARVKAKGGEPCEGSKSGR